MSGREVEAVVAIVAAVLAGLLAASYVAFCRSRLARPIDPFHFPLDPTPDVLWALVEEADRYVTTCCEREADSLEREWLC